MGKSKSRNSFYYFMLDFKQRSPIKFSNMKEVADAANPHWQKMTEEQRRPYEQKAKSDKNGAVKYTTTGVNIATMQRREEELLSKIQHMKDDIENTIYGAIEGGRVEEQAFYVMHINHYGYCNTTRQYIPAELAVTRFTLKSGVTQENVYHTIVKPGPLPLGYAYQAMKISGETHQIEPELGDSADSNLDRARIEFMAFMTEFNNRNVPPVYVEEKNKDAVENLLSILCLNSGHKEDYIKVYSLEHLFFTLRNAVGDNTQPKYPSIAMCKLELEKDKYDFCKDIPCSYHAASDVPYHCSKSRVIRLAYIICDNCCSDIGIELIPGQHVPSDSKITKRPQSSASKYAASSSSMSGAPCRKNPSRHNPKADNYFLSQRSESGLSVMSDTSSVSDLNDYAALGGCPYESELSQADTEEWMQPRPKHKRNKNSQLQSQVSVSSSEPTAELHFTSASADESSQPVNRRPVSLSAALTGTALTGIVSQLSGSSSSGLSRNILPVGRGRGRGIASNFTNRMP